MTLFVAGFGIWVVLNAFAWLFAKKGGCLCRFW